MTIDRSTFLVLTASIAAAGVGGWALRDQDAFGLGGKRTPPAQPIVAAPESAAVRPPPPPTATVAAAPPCDDSAGAVEACPPMGPAGEGACGNAAAKRCAEFKVAFKPKVAAQAVACIRALKGNEICDATRANLCGHAALMDACQEPEPSAAGAAGAQAVPAPVSAVASACDVIVRTCGSPPLGTTLSDCRRTLSGMTDAGRTAMVACITAHCSDRGLLGCEALVEPRPG
jgi:hypothetical protein